MIVVEGGTPLNGSVKVSGSKNACLPVLAATLLNEQPVRIHNAPQLMDVRIMGEVLASLGAAHCDNGGNGTIEINAGGVGNTEPPYELVNRMRASFLVLGPLLARFGEARVPLPGGCAIGARPVDEHLQVMEALGAKVTQESGHIVARAAKLTGTDIYLNIDSVGATENAIMAAALAEGKSTINNAALEPEVVDLCHFLERCGVDIENIGSKSITVHGQRRISAAVDYEVIPDRVEAGTYLLAIIGTGGTGTVECMVSEHLEALVYKLREAGVGMDIEEHSITVTDASQLKAVKVRTEAYPGFPTDLQPQMTAVLTIAEGVSTVSETIFEARLGHIPELARMGANVQISGDSAVITGLPRSRNGKRLTGVPVEAHDLRCSAAMVIAGLMANGVTHIKGRKHLVRGYCHLPEKAAGLGGKVSYVEEAVE